MGLIQGGQFSARKALCYIIFGIGGLILGLVVLPIERILIHPAERCRRAGRKTISLSHKLFVLVMRSFGILRLEGDMPDVSGLEGKIVAPNHPTLIDVVILFSIIGPANCIVSSRLLRGPLRFIIRQLYIENGEDFEKLVEDCRLSLSCGETLIIFPEGGRTREGCDITLKRGVAVISLRANAPIVPFFITGNDKRGLRKNERIWAINGEGCYTFRIERCERELVPADYKEGSFREGTFRMTRDLEEILREGALSSSSF